MLMYLAYIALFVVVMWMGISVLRALSRPMPPPPPPGEMRRMSLRFRCTICGAEVKMTAAAQEDPEPPRHCLEDMQLVTPVE